jgi:hypothetical protein
MKLSEAHPPIALTARQRAELAKIRVQHPRARVSVPFRQTALPLIRVRLRWPGHRNATVLLAPDGHRLVSASLLGGKP